MSRSTGSKDILRVFACPPFPLSPFWMALSIFHLSCVERGKTQPSREFLKKLYAVYGLSADEILYGQPSSQIRRRKKFLASIELTARETELIERIEGKLFIEKFVPIPIARGEISAGTPREVEEQPEGVAIIYRDWAKNRKHFTAVRIKRGSMRPTIPDGSLVGIDHSQRDPRVLDGKVVAIPKNGEATIKRLRVIGRKDSRSKAIVLGAPDNPDFVDETIAFAGEEINDAIVGKVGCYNKIFKHC